MSENLLKTGFDVDHHICKDTRCAYKNSTISSYAVQ